MKKGPAIIVLLIVAAAFAGLGIFLDGEVIPSHSSSEDLLKGSVSKSAPATGSPAESASDRPSEIAQQLKVAIDTANRSETETTEKLAHSLTTSKERITQANRMLEERGIVPETDQSNEKSQKFSRRLESLKARLSQLQSTD